ncbi:MAG: hypothetical protein WKF70_12880, partial [Chitinophagaceae bacterium]
KGLLFSLVAVTAGLCLLGVVVYEWKSVNFGNLDLTYTLRLVIPGVMLASLGFESILFSFFIGVLRLPRR